MFKKAFASGGMAVLVSLFIFGVSTVFGANLPTQSPPGGLTSPTFSAVTASEFMAPVNKNLVLTSGQNIYLTGYDGPLAPSNTVHVNIVNGDLEVDDIVSVSSIKSTKNGNLHISALDSHDTNATVLKMQQNAVRIEGADTIYLSGDTNIGGLLNVDDDVAVSGSIEVTGSISDPYQDTLVIDDNLDVTGGIEFEGSLLGGVESTISSYNNSSYNNNVSGLSRVEDLKVLGGFTVYNQGADFLEGLDVGEGLHVTGETTIEGDLNVYGKLKADSIGVFTIKPGVYVTIAAKVGVNPSSNNTAAKTCAAGTTLISCGFESSSPGTDVYTFYPVGNTCFVSAQNNTAVIKKIRAIARCWDPSL